MSKQWIRICLWILVMLLLMCGLAQANEIPEGKEEVYREYMLKRAEMVQRLGIYGDWPVEEKAALDAFRLEMGLMEEGKEVHLLPDAQDISGEDALSLAWTAVTERFGADQSQLDYFQVQYHFISGGEGSGQPRWKLLLQSLEYVEPFTAYWVEMESPSGQVTRCEETYSQLIQSEEGSYSLEEGDISMEEAAKIAREYAAEHFQGRHPIPEWVFAGYKTITGIYFTDELGRSFGVELNPFDDELFEYFGTFSVQIDPKTGIVWGGHQGNG